jgi:hypothetical protein
MMEEYSKAWEAYFAGWLQAKGQTVQDLGLAWSGNGGENQLKREFVRWFESKLVFRHVQ